MAGLKRGDEEPWGAVLADVEPITDKNGFLSGEWGRCMVAAGRYEHSHPEWDQMAAYEANGPGGYVIEYLEQLGHERFTGAADKLEEDKSPRFAHFEFLKCLEQLFCF